MASAEMLDGKVTMAAGNQGLGLGLEHASSECSSSSSLEEICHSNSNSNSSLNSAYNSITNSGSYPASGSHFTSNVEDFKRAYVGALLPELARIQQTGGTTAAPTAAAMAVSWRAVKDAADLALAAAARRESNWRLALMEEVLLKRRRRRKWTRASRIITTTRVTSRKTNLLGSRGYIKVLRNVIKTAWSEKSSRYRSQRRRLLMPRQQRLIRRRLGRVVPGGMSMDVPLLLRETADYILTLQLQVDTLRSLHAHLASGQITV